MSKTGYVVKQYTGQDHEYYEVKRIEAYNFDHTQGYAYTFKNDLGMEEFVVAPLDYVPGIYRGMKVITAVRGNSSAAVMRALPLDSECPGDDLQELVRSHVMKRGYQSMYGKGQMMKYIIIGFVVVVGIIAAVIVFKQFAPAEPSVVPPVPGQSSFEPTK